MLSFRFRVKSVRRPADGQKDLSLGVNVRRQEHEAIRVLRRPRKAPHSKDKRALIWRNIRPKLNLLRGSGVLVEERTTSVLSHFARRANRRLLASESRSEGVKIRDGFVCPASHSST